MLSVRKVLFRVFALLGLALPAYAAERAIIVLDGSGSMWAQIDGEARITIARDTLSSVLAELPDDLELGFMTYGHREKGNCADIEMLVEPALGTGAAITAAAEAISPKGMTPISDAVRLAAEDLLYTEEKATVILITDGLETCEVDPCALASELEAQGVDFTTHVLGFGLSDAEGQQVACLAENTGGQYLQAEDGEALVRALTTTVAQVTQATPAPAPEPEPVPAPEPPAALTINLKPTVSLSEGGPDLVDGTYDITWSWYKPAADGSAGEHVGTGYYSSFEDKLEPGDYILTVEVSYASSSQPVTIAESTLATPHFVLDAAILKLHPLSSEGADIDNEAATEIRQDGEYVTTDYGDVNLVVPAGPLEVDVAIGKGSVTRSYAPKAGETIDEDVIIGVGIANINALYVEGMAVEDDIYVELFEAAEAIDGTRKSVDYGYGGVQSFTVPEGDYVAVYDLDGAVGEVPFSVKTGDAVDVSLLLDAGVLAVTTPADDYVEILSGSKDIAGKRDSFDYGYGPMFQTTLKAGEYVVYSKKGDLESETPITIKGGERFELTIEAAAATKKK